MRLSLLRSALVIASFAAGLRLDAALDLNGNQQSDVWEALQSAKGLGANADTDGDGFTNAQEAVAGTDPRDPTSRPELSLKLLGASLSHAWPSELGKRYRLESSASLDAASWQTVATLDGNGALLTLNTAPTGARQFFRLAIADRDADGDGLSDWEEIALGFDPASAHTERFDTLDLARVSAGWNAASVVSVAPLDAAMSERWPDPGVIAIRRTGGLQPLQVSFVLTGSATAGVDYTVDPAQAATTTSIIIPAGASEAWVQLVPVADAADTEGTETITLTLQPAAGYTLATPSATVATSATLTLANETASSVLATPNAKSAARFLVQAAFGPDQDSADDADIIPENVETVMARGFAGWLDDQFAKPATFLQPFTEYAPTIPDFYIDPKLAAWWSRAMGAPVSFPGGPAVDYDVLRQRVAFCLSQIVVVSDRPEVLAVEPVAMANYYDMLLKHAFGNYRDLLYDVARHPVMGFYLSSLKNQKPDPVNNIFPDENFAREIMQLFSIGLWELNADGSRRLDADGRPISTYDNTTITSLARVFTGLSYGGATRTSFLYAPKNLTHPMEMWDEFHDLAPKTLLNGTTLPARVASNPDVGIAGLMDLDATIENLFQHPNVGPFIGRQLIQRLVTSNPSPAYIARVSAAFADNGAGVRGDLKAVIRAILLDDEARDPARRSDPHFGKVREPFLRVVNFARAFDAASTSGLYPLSSFFMDHYEEPMKAPSVFNFYLPGYTPPGEIQAAGLVAPELQVVNATSAISAPNYYHNAVFGGLHRWGTGTPSHNVTLKLDAELALANDPDALIRRLDLALTFGELSPRQFQIIRQALLRISTATWEWERERVRLAITLIVTSPEFCVLR